MMKKVQNKAKMPVLLATLFVSVSLFARDVRGHVVDAVTGEYPHFGSREMKHTWKHPRFGYFVPCVMLV